MEKTKKKTTEKMNEKISENTREDCHDVRCHIHGNLKTRGKIFEGRVTKKFSTRVVIELERMIYIRKYERYLRSKIKIHAKLPKCMEKEINVGDLIRIQECRPLSKIIHFTVIKKLKSAGER